MASQGKRLSNYLLDLAFLYVFSLTVGFILGIFLIFYSPSLFDSITEENMFTEYLLGFIMGMIYYTTFEALTGRTMAKYITRTKVVDENGEKPDFKTIFLRSLCRFIPFEAFSFLGSDNSGWHDKFTKTKVVEIEKKSL
ncbi:MAG: RDD family protein [Bacteroidia bacterium]|nr:RDD family protein [Bacteroidia bacterium]